MKPKTIRTDERIFEVTNSEGKTYLCNLNHFKLDSEGRKLLTKEGVSIVLLRHYWNNTLKKISKRNVKDMLLAQRKPTKTA